MKRTLLLGLIAILIISACKKKNDDVVISLKGKWNAQSVSYKEFDNGALINSYSENLIKTTFDFRNNGSLIITDEYGTETFSYSIQNATTVEFDGMVFEIRNLTGNSVTLYTREEYAPNNYAELTFNLTR